MCVCTGHIVCVYVCLCSSPRRHACSVNYHLVAGAEANACSGTDAGASKGKGKGGGQGRGSDDKGKGKGVLKAVGKGKAGG